MASLRRQQAIDRYVEPTLFFKRRKDGRKRGQYQPDSGNVYQKLREEVICSLLERADKFQNELIILGHFSTRYHDRQVKAAIEKRLPEHLRERVKLWC